jgi:hypothetical protein
LNDCAKTEEEIKEMESKPYESLVGSLLYAAISTRLDIAHAVNVGSRFMKTHGGKHWIAMKRVLRYLKGTAKLKLTFNCANVNNECVNVSAFSDADWGGDLDDRKSTTGYIVKVNGCAVNWMSKKQPTVALSSAEAEYMAMVNATQEILWTVNLLKEMKQSVKEPVVLMTDNQAAESISKNDTNHSKTKHIDIKHHFIRDVIKNEQMVVQWIDTNNQEADILTKALGETKFIRLRNIIYEKQQ